MQESCPSTKCSQLKVFPPQLLAGGLNPPTSPQSCDRIGQEGFSPLPLLDFGSILTQLGIWGV